MKQPREQKGIGRLLALSGEKPGRLYLGAACSILGTIVQLTPFLAVYQVMASLLRSAAEGGPLDGTFLMRWAALGLAGMLVGYLLSYIGGMLSHTFAYRVVCGVRLRAAEHIGRLPMGYVNSNAVGKIRQILDGDVEQLEGFLAHQLPDFLSTVVMLFVLFIAMAAVNFWLALACLLPIAVGFGCQLAVMVKLMKDGAVKENFDALENISASSAQYVRGMPSIKIFGQTVKSFQRFYQDIVRYRDFTIRMTELVRPGYVKFRMFVLSVAVFLVPVGLLLYLRDSADVSLAVTFLFFLILGPGASAPTLKLRGFAEGMNTIGESVSRVEAVFDQAVLPEPEEGKLPVDHDIVFDHVSFSYEEGREALRDVSFAAKQGEITALVGPSGAGKSTIAQLISRFWDVTGGSIKIGGVDVREMRTEDLMEQISFVFQDSFLFADTVYQNIAMGRPEASREEVYAAAKAARCHEFIRNLPDGYDTLIGEGGSTLSGGEKQRISIARAILKNAPILILDEATAAADAENEREVQRAIQALIREKTVIMIAHRLKTIRDAEQILVISEGTVTERGTHWELLKKRGLYAAMWEASVASAAWKMETGKEAVQ